MSRRLDWERATKQARIATQGYEGSGADEELPGATTPSEARADYIHRAVVAAVAGRKVPMPSPVLLRYFEAEFPNGSVEDWVLAQPEFHKALRRRAHFRTQQRAQDLAKLADIERAFRRPPLPPSSLGESPTPETPEDVWAWARRQPEYADLLKKKPRKKGRFS